MKGLSIQVVSAYSVSRREYVDAIQGIHRSLGWSHYDEDVVSTRRDVFVAMEADKIVGYVSYLLQNDNTVYISYLAVDQTFQRQGVGRSLMGRVVDLCRENQWKSLELDYRANVEKTASFYREFARESGASYTEEDNGYYDNGDPCKLFVMQVSSGFSVK